MAAGKPLSNQTAVILGSAEYLRAITLDDEGDLHGWVRRTLEKSEGHGAGIMRVPVGLRETRHESVKVDVKPRVGELRQSAPLTLENVGA
jgi:hypothetical protein